MPNSLMKFTQQQAPMMSGQMTPDMLARQGGMNMPQMVNQIKRFGSMFHGNAKQKVMSMVQQGVRSNEQLNQAMNIAQQFKGMF